MRKRRAIRALRQQQDKLSDIHQIDDTWHSYTADLIKLYIGVDSDQYIDIRPKLHSKISNYRERGALAQQVERFKRQIDNAISYIEANGVDQPVFPWRWLEQQNQQMIYGALVAILTAIATVSFFIGRHCSKYKVEELRRENTELRLLLTTTPSSTSTRQKPQ